MEEKHDWHVFIVNVRDFAIVLCRPVSIFFPEPYLLPPFPRPPAPRARVLIRQRPTLLLTLLRRNPALVDTRHVEV